MDKIVIYHDLEKENKHGFSFPETTPQQNQNNLVVREQVIPGAFGYPNMYIRHLNFRHQNHDYLIISMTDYELTHTKRAGIVISALHFLQNQPPDEPIG